MDFKQIKKQSLIIIFNRGLIAFFSLLLEIISIQYLSVDLKGEFFYIKANIELFAYMFTFGMGISIIHFRTKYGNMYDRQILKWILISFTILISFAIIFYNIEFITKYLFIDKKYFILASIGSFFTLLSFYLQKIFLSDNNLKLHNQVIFYTKVIVTLALIFIMILIDNIKLYHLLIVVPIGLFIVTSYFSFKLKLNYKSHLVNNKFFKFNIGIFFYEIIYQLKTKFDNFLVLYFFGITSVGLFSVAVSFGALVLIVSSSISLILLKELSAVKDKITQTNFMSLFKKYLIVIFAITILSIIFVYIIVHLYGDGKFIDSFYIYIVYSISLILFSIVTFFKSYFSSIKKTNIQLYSSLISTTPYLSLFILDVKNINVLLSIIITSNLLQCIYLTIKKNQYFKEL